MKTIKHIILSLLLINTFFISCIVSKKQNISLVINNETVKYFPINYQYYQKIEKYKYDKLFFEIHNNTKQSFAIPIDTTEFTFYDDYNYNTYFPNNYNDSIYFKKPFIDLTKQWYRFSILIKDPNNNLSITSYDSNNFDYFENIPPLDSFFKTNLFILKKGESLKLMHKIFLPINTVLYEKPNKYISLIVSDLLVNSKKVYTLELQIKIDSNNIKQYLSKEKLDSLQKNNIKIFNGELKSNKVPLTRG